MKIELAKVGVICLLDKVPNPYLIIGHDIINEEKNIIIIDKDMNIQHVNHSRLS